MNAVLKWQWFDLKDFACHCGCEQNHMAPDFVNKLDSLRTHLGFPLIVSSGYRCPEYNNLVSSTGLYGPHTTGRAVDFLVNGEKALRLLQIAANRAFTGIGINQKGNFNTRFIHLDDISQGQRPWIWTY